MTDPVLTYFRDSVGLAVAAPTAKLPPLPKLVTGVYTQAQVRDWYGGGGRWRQTWPGSTGRALAQADVSGTCMVYLRQPQVAPVQGRADLMQQFFAQVQRQERE